MHFLTLCLLMSSVHNLCKQIGPTKRLFDTQMVFLKELFEKNYFEKISRRQKSVRNFPTNAVCF